MANFVEEGEGDEVAKGKRETFVPSLVLAMLNVNSGSQITLPISHQPIVKKKIPHPSLKELRVTQMTPAPS